MIFLKKVISLLNIFKIIRLIKDFNKDLINKNVFINLKITKSGNNNLFIPYNYNIRDK